MRVLVFLLLLTVAFPLFGQQQIRKWSDKSGEFTVRAKLVKVEGETVTLEKEAGGTVEVPIAKLSDKDREFVEKLSAAKPTKKSPTKNRTEPIQEIIYPTKDFWEIKLFP